MAAIIKDFTVASMPGLQAESYSDGLDHHSHVAGSRSESLMP
jgi:hypothetical protein